MLNTGSRTLATLLSILFAVSCAFAYEVDDTVPEVQERVARVSFLRGEVQIRREGSDEWEKADLNLPVVEGDELAAGPDGRVEIQFGAETHVRLAENSLMQVRQLTDDGVALSVPRGSAVIALKRFDADKEFFEIDAPGTTVAVQRTGSYRIDAGGDDSRQVRVSVTDEGEARVYSAQSGLTLRSGRSATVMVEGDLAGEWDTADAGRYQDEFDEWSAERDTIIEKRLAEAHYDEYYDRDIYGAEELNDHGDWEFTSDYGYVWRPRPSAISSYADWSPYRYGSWRWVPPFGWTWVNDEPWGWATYHHGRWIFHRGRWVWTPYAYYRTNRSWWYPALVIIRIIDRNICWYPAGYRHRYRNYNGYHDWIGRRRRDRDRRRPGGVAANPTPTPPVRQPTTRPIGKVAPPDDEIPTRGVVTLPKDDFGTGRKIGKIAPPEIVKGIISKPAEDTPELPKYEAVKPKIGREILVRPEEAVSKGIIRRPSGAAERKYEAPLDTELKKVRFYGDRQPVRQAETRVPADTTTARPPRTTGAVERPQRPKQETTVSDPVRQDTPPVRSVPTKTEPPVVVPRQNPPAQERPQPPIRRETPAPRQETPKYEPPVRKEQPRSDPPPRKEIPAPRNDPPPRREIPRSDPPKQSPPPKSEDRKPDVKGSPAPASRKRDSK